MRFISINTVSRFVKCIGRGCSNGSVQRVVGGGRLGGVEKTIEGSSGLINYRYKFRVQLFMLCLSRGVERRGMGWGVGGGGWRV